MEFVVKTSTRRNLFMLLIPCYVTLVKLAPDINLDAFFDPVVAYQSSSKRIGRVALIF